MIRFQFSFLLLIITFNFGCKKKEIKEFKNMATVGAVEIWCDESLKNIIEQELDVFQTDYKNTAITIHYNNEQTIKKHFYTDSAYVIVISSEIDSYDIKKFNSKQIYPKQFHFATSAIAFITSKKSNVDSFSQQNIIEMLSSLKKDGTIFVIENKDSGLANNLIQYMNGKQLGSNVFAKNNKAEVIDYVNNNPNSIGILDWSELSDSDDSEAQNILNTIDLIGISTPLSKGIFYKPYQYNLNGNYPFLRKLYFIRKFNKTDVSLGFASFICEERGQKIILKAGLLPAYQTERTVEIKKIGNIEVIK